VTAPYRSIELSPAFMRSILDLRPVEQRRVIAAVLLLDENERHPLLRVHQLQGDRAGQWSASASDSLRITFQRLPEGRKRLIAASRHYGD
jgi:hypothetical protein